MTSNCDNIVNPSYDEVDIDKLAKQQLVIETISNHLSSTSTHEIIRQIHDAIANGYTLTCKTLSGGYTNYSYKVWVANQPHLCLFAKLSFEYALWNPDKSSHYSLKRTENEWEIMMRASEIVPGCVVKPLGCWDVHQDEQRMKLLVTEWSTADEQFCNQFIDGVVDPRIAPKLADLFATLHSIEKFDPDFNVNVKPCMENLLDQMKECVIAACSIEKPSNRTEKYCVKEGAAVLGKVVDDIIANYHQRDCLIHSDSHVFNILVESKPSVEELELFGPNGTMVLCDWEMAMAGPMGRDVGLALAFPIACYIAHALNGEVVKSISNYITTLVDCYLDKMNEMGAPCYNKSYLYRNIIGWSGWFQFVALHWMKSMDSYPVQNNESKKVYVQDIMGVLGLKMMRFATDNQYISDEATLDEVKAKFDDMLEEEVSMAYHVFADERHTSRHVMKPRKSSFLRAANRRVSDAKLNFEPVERSLSELDFDSFDDFLFSGTAS